jgi:hypothetical protein
MRIRFNALTWERPIKRSTGFVLAGSGDDARLKKKEGFETVSYTPTASLVAELCNVRDADGVVNFTNRWGTLFRDAEGVRANRWGKPGAGPWWDVSRFLREAKSLRRLQVISSLNDFTELKRNSLFPEKGYFKVTFADELMKMRSEAYTSQKWELDKNGDIVCTPASLIEFIKAEFIQSLEKDQFRVPCEMCGKLFVAQRRDARLCSQKCRMAASRAGLTRKRTKTTKKTTKITKKTTSKKRSK